MTLTKLSNKQLILCLPSELRAAGARLLTLAMDASELDSEYRDTLTRSSDALLIAAKKLEKYMRDNDGDTDWLTDSLLD